ncbi:MAG: type II secretion system secretin GspD [Candidatus Methylumidiphilus sp.]
MKLFLFRPKTFPQTPRRNKAPAGAGRRVGAAVSLGLALLSGCENLGPAGVRKMTIPPSLVVQDKKAQEETPPANVVVENRGATQTEVYPPAGPLFAAPTPEAASDKKPFHAKQGKYTLNFEDADLGEVAKVILGDTLKVNYVISPKVTGKVSLQTTRPLAEDEMVPTLEMLLKANGAVLIQEHGLYRIEPEGTATINAPSTRLGLAGQSVPEGYQLRVVPLRYVGVAEMQKVIEPLMPPKSVIRADESRNLLLLAGTADELESVLETIRIFDVDFMRGMSVALFPLKNVEATTIAEELDKLLTISGKGPLTGMFRLMPLERLNAILVVTPQPRYLDEVQTWIERLDRYNTAKTGNMHVYHVQNVDALELANTLSNIFGQNQGRSRQPGASLSPGLSGSSVSGGSSSGGFDSGGGSSGLGGSSSSSGFGGSSSGLGSSSSSSGLGGSSSSSFGGGTSGTPNLGSGGSSMGGSSSSSFGSGSASGGGFGGSSGGFGSSGGSRQNRGRSGSAVADLGNNMKIVADPSNNALIIMAKAQEYRDIEAVIKQLDVMPLQVLVDATIVEVALTDELQYGLQWYFSHRSDNGRTIGAGQFGKAITDASGALVSGAAASGGFTYALVNMGKNIQLELNALAASNKINVLSAPSLMVLNNQEANIKVGDQVPILTAQALPTAGTTGLVGTQSIQYKDTGVLLSVRPRVNAGGLVTMEIEQAVDNVKSQTSGGIESPTIAQRKIRSSVAVKNGETIVLGGLIIENTSNNLTGIPVLAQLPWVGALFSSTSKKLNRTELVVMMTPRVVDSAQSSQDITNEFRRKLTGLYEQRPNSPSPIILEQGVGVYPAEQPPQQ